MEEVKCYYNSPVSLAQAEKYIEASLVTTAREYVAIGHWLRRIRDDKLFLEEGYKNFEEYVRQKYHKDAGWASKCIKVNAQFSVGGNSPHLSEEYRSYSKYQLVELAYMSEGQRELVGPDTPVRAMKQIRKPEVVTSQVDPAPDPQGEEPEEKVVTSQSEMVAESAAVQEPEFEEEQPKEPLSAYGTPREVYPEDSLITTPGCEGGHDCFCCHLDCDIRQQDCYCVEAPMGNPFPCEMVPKIQELQEKTGDRCQMVNHDLAYHRAGDHEPVPCCKKCADPCEYMCSRARNVRGSSVAAELVEEARPWEEEKIDESYNIGDLPQAKESLLRQLAKVLVERCGSRMVLDGVTHIGRGTKERLRDIDRQDDGITLQDGVQAYPSEEIIEFFRGEEDLGVCTYARFETQARKALDEWVRAGKPQSKPEPEPEPPKEVIDAEFAEIPAEPEAEELTDLQIARQELERANNLLTKCLEYMQGETNIHIKSLKIKAASLALYVRDLEGFSKPEQPELPILRNNDQRSEFLDAYETWPLWIEAVQTGERYYRYDLKDGTSIVVKVYHAMLFDYTVSGVKYEERFTEGYGQHEYYLLQPGKFFRDCETNRTALIEKLKEIQRKG